ncbi:hypothetical protein BKA65DRAFT_492099 [Rhexocercosporidium sp. MPI-PUGE-AT-0058]|nr:hypothetical protein BKA65DRAFT_492099 [Rhexocercosporidium sp. MPI-PUGE-AT-0058]
MAQNLQRTRRKSPKPAKSLGKDIRNCDEKRKSPCGCVVDPEQSAKRLRFSARNLDGSSSSSEGSEDDSFSSAVFADGLNNKVEVQMNAALEAKLQEFGFKPNKATSDLANISVKTTNLFEESTCASAELEDTKTRLVETEEREAGLQEASKHNVTEPTLNVLRDENDRLRANLKKQELDHYQDKQILEQIRTELEVTKEILNDLRDENEDLQFDISLKELNRCKERHDLNQIRIDLEQTRIQLKDCQESEAGLRRANDGSNALPRRRSPRRLISHNEHSKKSLQVPESSRHTMANAIVPKACEEDLDAEKKDLEARLQHMTE